MPKLIHSTPKYRKHRASGQAVVTIQGRDVYLGPYGTKTSHSEYDRVIAEWLAHGRQLPAETDGSLTMNELMRDYLRYAKVYYQPQHSGHYEVTRIKDALREVKRLYGRTPVAQFGPKRLKVVRQKWVDLKRTRRHINTLLGIVKRMFKWAVAEELVPPDVYQALATVEGLKRGRTSAKESAPVLPVVDATVDATIPFAPAVVADMVRFQRLTGCRPGEVCILRPRDLDRSEDVWAYTPFTHKTEYRGRSRIIFIGPKAQAILTPYLLRPEDEYCFSPRDSERRRRQLAHESRQTPLSCGNRPGTNRRRQPAKTAGACYTNDSYRRAIHRAVEKSNAERKKWNAQHPDQKVTLLELWAPNRLRHAAATTIRHHANVETARVVLGHAGVATTELYAEQDHEKARDIMRQLG